MAAQSRQNRSTSSPAPEAANAQSGQAAAGRGNAFAAEQLRGQASPDVASVRPLKVAAPRPVQAGEQTRTVLGVRIIGRDVSPSALDACEDFVTRTVGRRQDIQERLAAARVALVIIPRDKKMTDVPEFAALRGTQTFDGRVWDDVRGSGGMQSGDLWAIGVPEENLVEAGPDAYGSGYSVGLHEFAHTIHSRGLPSSERRELERLYAARAQAGGPWTEAYGASNVDEYFAQSTNCFFGENNGVGHNGAGWLRDNDRPMYDFLVRIYGPAAGEGGGGATGGATGGGATGGGATGGGRGRGGRR